MILSILKLYDFNLSEIYIFIDSVKCLLNKNMLKNQIWLTNMLKPQTHQNTNYMKYNNKYYVNIKTEKL